MCQNIHPFWGHRNGVFRQTIRMPFSTIVINDVDLVVKGIVAMLEPFDDVEIVGMQAGELSHARAEVALVDAFGRSDAGLERITDVQRIGEFDHVVLFSWNLTPIEIDRALAVGVSGILSKAETADVIVKDLRRIRDGEKIVHDFPFTRVAEWTKGDSESSLSDREIEILTLLAHGLTNREIAADLYLAESTVKTYLKQLYRKLDISSRTQAVMRAVELGVATSSRTYR